MTHLYTTPGTDPEEDFRAEGSVSPAESSDARSLSPSRRPWLDRLPRERLPPAPWGLGRALGVLVVALVLTVILGLLFGFVLFVGFDRGFNHHHPIAWMLSALQIQEIAFLAGIPLLILGRFHVGLRSLGLRRVPAQLLLLGVVGAIAALVAEEVVDVLFRLVAPHWLQSNISETFGGIRHLNAGVGFLLFAAVAIEAPLVEEILFRGVAYQGAKRFFARWLGPQATVFAAALLSALLFGLAHFEPHTLPYLVVAGIIYAYVFEISGSLYVSALAHGVGNAIAFAAWLQTL